ncbi:MAG: DUF5666 domain-containing protein [Gammaproteobacteria bacterium]|nr:DUF5666 domain-containing protein [Gammaproteobacteria bacterium]
MRTNTVSAIKLLGVFFFSAVWLSACGEGGVIGTGATETVSVGVIQSRSANQITVNNVKYDTAQAAITRNKSSVSNDALNVGMVATVTGKVNDDGANGTASSVQVKDLISGPVTAIEDSNTVIVMGQRVHVDDATVFFNTVKDDSFIKDKIIVINGYIGEDGKIYATYVENDDDNGTGETHVKGFIKDLDSNTQRFNLGLLAVDYQSASFEHGSEQDLQNGLLVEVEGVFDATLNLLAAQKIEIEDRYTNLKQQEQLELEGIVSAINETQIVVNGVTIQLNANTRYEHGNKADVTLGKKVQIHARRDSAGALVASEVEIKSGVSQQSSGSENESDESGDGSESNGNDDNSEDSGSEVSDNDSNLSISEVARLRANIAAVDTVAQTLKLSYGGQYAVTDATDYNGIVNLSSLSVGDHVEVRLAQNAGNLVISRLDFKNSYAEEDVLIEGKLDAINNPLITIAGLQIDASDIEGGTAVLAQGQIGNTVELKGEDNGTAVTWKEIELK